MRGRDEGLAVDGGANVAAIDITTIGIFEVLASGDADVRVVITVGVDGVCSIAPVKCDAGICPDAVLGTVGLDLSAANIDGMACLNSNAAVAAVGGGRDFATADPDVISEDCCCATGTAGGRDLAAADADVVVVDIDGVTTTGCGGVYLATVDVE